MRRLTRPLTFAAVTLFGVPAVAQVAPPAPAAPAAETTEASEEEGEGDGEKAGATAPDAGEEGPGDAPAEPEAPPRPPAEPMTDADDVARLEALRDLVRRYEEEARDFRDQVRLVAERKYKERRARIESNYDKALAPVMAAERRYRLDAIATFERFLERHPDNKRYTPDALFRLAELYFEKYDDEYQQATKEFREAYAKWLEETDGEGEPPPEPQQKFERTVQLYQQLIDNFPEYRLIDGAYYLLGYTLRAQGDMEEGLAAWQTLVDRYPNSRFYAEVWFRIGDHHFDEERWDEAVAAFKQVVPLTESQFYDKALYKLAWTYYLVNRFDDSVNRFFELLDFSYAKKAEEGLEEGSGSVLEEEALQYVAISFSDDNWDRPVEYKTLVSGESFEDDFAEIQIDYVRFAIDWFKRVGEKPYERDVIAKLGDILFKQSKNLQSVQALKHAISLDPMHREAPKLQGLVVQAYERERMFEDASRERDLLVATYGTGTQWAAEHQDDSEARNEAQELARTSLYTAAIYYHQQANKYFEDGRQDLGVTAFEAASAAYRDYLKQYPHDKQAYELTFYLAETYYYSLHFPEAAETYEKVRDSTQGKQYRVESARNVVYALEKVIDSKVKAGELPEKDPFKSDGPESADAASETDESGAPKSASADKPAEDKPAEEIAPLRQRYVKGVDAFLALKPKDEVAPNFAYAAAAIFYAHNHFDEANKRFEAIVNNYPTSEAAKFAANLILDRLIAQKDWTKAAEYAARFSETVTSGDKGVFAKIEGGAKFKIAQKTLEEGGKDIEEGRIAEGIAKLEEGSRAYLKLVEDDPKREFADLMVYNAAVSLETARKPAEAAKLYERVYKEYPDSKYASEAMFQVASKSEQSFDFAKAVDTYQLLVKKYPESERRADAQINAALALEGQQKYGAAATAFQRFATLFPERPEAPEVFYRSAIVHKKRGNAAAEARALRDFIRRYRGKKDVVPRVVEAYVRLGDMDEEEAEKATRGSQIRKARKSAEDNFEKALKEYKRAKDSPAATYFAAKAAFSLAEFDYSDYEKMAISGRTGKAQGKALTDKSKKLQDVEKTFKGVITTYKQAEWSLASLYRVGSLYDDLQRKIIQAPCPADIKRIDPIACDEYRTVLEDQAFAVEEKAVEAYRVAYQRSKELKLSNKWTKRTLEALNRLRKAEFPIDNEPIEEPTRGDTYSLGLVFPNGGAQELQRLPGGGEEGK